ncbi:MAG: hypothetical protein R3F60_21360 [bacterium]
MIRTNKHHQAISAIQAVLIGLRTMAYEKVDHNELAWILDVAEFLPALMLEPTDRTDAFRGSLADLAARYPSFNWALERFDKEDD